MFKLKNKNINIQFSALNLSIYKDLSQKEENDFFASYNLPNDLFSFDKIKSVAPRHEKITNNQLGPINILVFSNIQSTTPLTDVESRLETHVFILSENESFWFIKDSYSNLYDELVSSHLEDIHTIKDLILCATLLTYRNFIQELDNHKQRINYLSKQANRQTNNQILKEVTETEKNLVILEHIIETQEIAIDSLKKFEQFDDNELLQKVNRYQNQVNRLVHVYRDLFDAVSSLYSDIVSNNLNMLMKFLSSLSIVLAASSFIAELWGMNTGGLPFEHHPLGTFIMITIAIIAGLLMYIFLKRKHFFDD